MAGCRLPARTSLPFQPAHPARPRAARQRPFAGSHPRHRCPSACRPWGSAQDVPFPEQLRIMSRVSLLVMVHGSAISLWPFLPPNAVAVHISPDVESSDNLQRVWADHYVRRPGRQGKGPGARSRRLAAMGWTALMGRPPALPAWADSSRS